MQSRNKINEMARTIVDAFGPTDISQLTPREVRRLHDDALGINGEAAVLQHQEEAATLLAKKLICENLGSGLLDISPANGVGGRLRDIQRKLKKLGHESEKSKVAVILAFATLARQEIFQLLVNDQGYFSYLGEVGINQQTRRK